MPGVLRPVTALLIGVAFLLTGHGLLLTVVPLRASAEAFGSVEIGLLGSAYYVGFVAGCLLTPFLILRAGHIRAFAALIALAVVSALVLPLAIGFWPWFAARAGTGISLAGLFMVIESWLNARSSNQNRGFVFSAYITVNFLAIALGQLIVASDDPSDFKLFLIGGIAIALATIPVVLTKSAQPAPIALVRFRPIELYRRSPVGVVGVTMIGLATGSFWALAAVFAVAKGLGPDQAALFVGVAVLGGMAAQWPVGRLSDRFDRRTVLLALLITSAVVGIALAVLPLGNAAVLVMAFPLGATLHACYPIAVAHTFDYADRGEYVHTSAGLLFANGLGSMVGPIAASALMVGIGAGGLFVFTALAQVGLSGFILYRLQRRGSLTTDMKVGFDLGATSQRGAVLTPEPLDPNDPDVAVPPDVPPPEAPVAEAAPSPEPTDISAESERPEAVAAEQR
jgi:MFS family permease